MKQLRIFMFLLAATVLQPTAASAQELIAPARQWTVEDTWGPGLPEGMTKKQRDQLQREFRDKVCYRRSRVTLEYPTQHPARRIFITCN